MYFSVSHRIRKNFIVPAVCTVSLISAYSCSSQCPVSEKEECPASINTDKIQLNQLDSASRERLKREILAEIKEETRQQWIHEFENAMPVAPKPSSLDSEPEKTDPPKARPIQLPPTQKIERDAGGIKILRLTFTTQVVHRLPVDERDAFSVSDASVFCFAEISAAEAVDRMITIKFTHSTGLTQSFSLPVSQSPAWRTWSKLNLTKAMTGTWLCEVFNEDNELLASRPFVVVD